MIQHWGRDWQACDRYRSPHGFAQLTEFLSEVIDAADPVQQKAMIRSEDSFNLWQSILRGSGVVTGCRRCQDVCPIGADYESALKDALDEIPEDNPEKQARLERMSNDEAADRWPQQYAYQSRWIGRRSPDSV